MELFEPRQETIFPTDFEEILQRVRRINPVKYGSTRNYINGSVTYLSPYISRGIISTKFILEETLKKGFKPTQIEKFIQELAWRDYWQQIWISKGSSINLDLKHTQSPVANKDIPKAILEASTGITAIDVAIENFYVSGYLHNHLRMYIASIACNIGQSHWKTPAKWMYYHLLDADWASNALSWQWVAGSNANKKYVANQENINRYCFTEQKDTFLDEPYDKLPLKKIPQVLLETEKFSLKTNLPPQKSLNIVEDTGTCIYNFYNLDPLWQKDSAKNRILLLEPSHFKQYPISQKSIDFMINCAKKNINNIQIFVGEFDDLYPKIHNHEISFKEHPLNKHYTGKEESRDWMFEVKGYYSSFFSFWKKCKKELDF